MNSGIEDNIKGIVKSTVKNPNPVNMSIKETDSEKAKIKADLFNRLWNITSKRGIPKFESTEAAALLIEEYFKDCAEANLRPTIRGLAAALGTVYSTLNDWENGSRDAQLGSSYSSMIKKAKQFIAEYDELLAVEGVDNPILYMFRAKNYYGMQDKQDITITPNNNLEAGHTPDEIAKQIESDIPIDME